MRFEILLLLFLITRSTFSQEVENFRLQDALENTNPETEESENERFEILDLDRPLPDLNRLSDQAFREISILSPLQTESIIRYRIQYGPLLEIYELQVIPDLDEKAIFQLLSIVTITPPKARISTKDLKNLSAQTLLRWQRVLEKQEGYRPDSSKGKRSYAGSPDKFLIRNQISLKNWLKVGITGEKDGGETFHSSGFDFYSAYLFYKPAGLVKEIYIGDFSARFGQGLVFWTGPAFGKSIDLISVKKNSKGFSPYSGVDESLFLRGLAISVGNESIIVNAFASRKAIDGTMQSPSIDDTGDDFPIAVVSHSGFNRTDSERAKKDQLRETDLGINLQFRQKRFQLGWSTTADFLESREKIKERGPSINWRTGADYSFSSGVILLFGEAAISSSGYGILQGLIMSPARHLDLSILARSFSKEYSSGKVSAFSENSTPINEHGIYLGIASKANKPLVINAYLDYYTIPWLKYRIDAPSTGHDLGVQGTWNFSRESNLMVRYSFQESGRNEETEFNNIDPVVSEIRKSIRIHLNYPGTAQLEFRSRAELVWFQKSINHERGFLLFQDIIYQLSLRIKLSTRMEIFNTSSFDSRMYAMEQDVLYKYSSPALSGSGSRMYFLSRIKLSKTLDCWLKLSQTYYFDREEIGTGGELIEGNRKTDLTLQLRVKF